MLLKSLQNHLMDEESKMTQLEGIESCTLSSDLSLLSIIPYPVRRVRTTRSSTYSHAFQVTLPNPRTLSHKSSVIPRTSQLWN